jgi:uncharacterized phage-like protein YoqJ
MQIDISKTWCFTGHRPNKLYGYDKNDAGNLQLSIAINNAIRYLYLTHWIDTFISGMALGWDMWAALEVIELKQTYPLKLICAIPCKGHSDNFRENDKLLYDEILSKADYVHNVTGIKYFPRCMQIRDEWMVNNSSGQIAGWNGTRGGTYNTIMYANKVGKTSRITIQPQILSVTFQGL